MQCCLASQEICHPPVKLTEGDNQLQTLRGRPIIFFEGHGRLESLAAAIHFDTARGNMPTITGDKRRRRGYSDDTSGANSSRRTTGHESNTAQLLLSKTQMVSVLENAGLRKAEAPDLAMTLLEDKIDTLAALANVQWEDFSITPPIVVQQKLRRVDELVLSVEQDQRAPINLKVNGRYVDGNDVFFKIGKRTTLKKLMNAYIGRQALFNVPLVFFSFVGRRIEPTDTANSLEMQDEDEIDAELGDPSEFQRRGDQQLSLVRLSLVRGEFKNCSAPVRAPLMKYIAELLQDIDETVREEALSAFGESAAQPPDTNLVWREWWSSTAAKVSMGRFAQVPTSWTKELFLLLTVSECRSCACTCRMFAYMRSTFAMEERAPAIRSVAALLQTEKAEDSGSETAPTGEHTAGGDIRLRVQVVRQELTATYMYFETRRSTSLEGPIKALCRTHQNLDPDLLFFTFGGRRIKPMDTASSLGIKDEDEIHVKLESSVVKRTALLLLGNCSAAERAPFQHLMSAAKPAGPAFALAETASISASPTASLLHG